MQIWLFASIFIYTSQALILPEGVALEKWNEFKVLHGRRFINPSEENFRRAVFQKRLQHIEDHNERFRRGLETYEMGINKFTDYTEEEMRTYTGIEMPLQMSESFDTLDPNSNLELLVDAPSSFDWRSKGVLTPVKDQGNCGSCWAFATNGALEAHYKIHTNLTVILSEQQLVDCVYSEDYDGCDGGSYVEAYRYIAENGGINLQGDYPYEDKHGQCRYNGSMPHITLKGYHQVTPDEETLKNMVVNKGPISVSIDARGNFKGYQSGVYYNTSCSTTNTTHQVVIVGYGTENGQDYWLVKNSWGSDWGQDGYIKMARNRGNNCGIATNAYYPVLESSVSETSEETPIHVSPVVGRSSARSLASSLACLLACFIINNLYSC